MNRDFIENLMIMWPTGADFARRTRARVHAQPIEELIQEIQDLFDRLKYSKLTEDIMRYLIGILSGQPPPLNLPTFDRRTNKEFFIKTVLILEELLWNRPSETLNEFSKEGGTTALHCAWFAKFVEETRPVDRRLGSVSSFVREFVVAKFNSENGSARARLKVFFIWFFRFMIHEFITTPNISLGNIEDNDVAYYVEWGRDTANLVCSSVEVTQREFLKVRRISEYIRSCDRLIRNNIYPQCVREFARPYYEAMNRALEIMVRNSLSPERLDGPGGLIASYNSFYDHHVAFMRAPDGSQDQWDAATQCVEEIQNIQTHLTALGKNIEVITTAAFDFCTSAVAMCSNIPSTPPNNRAANDIRRLTHDIRTILDS